MVRGTGIEPVCSFSERVILKYLVAGSGIEPESFFKAASFKHAVFQPASPLAHFLVSLLETA